MHIFDAALVYASNDRDTECMESKAPASELRVACLSHTPLRGMLDPHSSVVDEIDQVLERIRQRIASFDPELVILFAPDHFNGFFYDLMPPFCIGTQAQAIGDFGSPAGAIDVPAELAAQCADFVMKQGIDLAVSHRMRVDHGFANPLHDLFGGMTKVPTVPVFVNSVAPPMPPIPRVRALGRAIGMFAAGLGKRVLIVGSGGLSHEPPVPQFAGATPEVAERLINGRNPSAQATQARRARLMDAAHRLAAQDEQVKPLNPRWDREFLELIRERRWAEFDAQHDEIISREAGNSAHEVRTWLAAMSAVEAIEQLEVSIDYYRPVPEWIAGFAVAWAEPAPMSNAPALA